MTDIDIIAGARPNFMKIGPIIHAIQDYNRSSQEKIKFRLIHTGQHYDKKMSEDFFDQLRIPKPHINMGVGSGSPATQSAKIMIAYEAALADYKPQLCIVVGDVTSTMACTIVAKKEGIKVAHVEGGIRSGDINMPEEINRIVTDSITDFFFTTSEHASENLRKLGHSDESIFFVGNTMIDSLEANLKRLKTPKLWEEKNVQDQNYLVMTLHRPSNVDVIENLKKLLRIINDNVDGRKVIFPMHPRTKKVFNRIRESFQNLIITEPMSYLEFIFLVKNSIGVITDSGGITEETTVLKVPCMTLRESTERPETVEIGTNEIVGTDQEKIKFYLSKLVQGKWKTGKIPPKWDGQAATRIVQILKDL